MQPWTSLELVSFWPQRSSSIGLRERLKSPRRLSDEEGSRKRSPAEKTRGMLFELMEEERHIRKVLCYFPRANGRSDDSSSEDDETDAEPPIAVATEATPTVWLDTLAEKHRQGRCSSIKRDKPSQKAGLAKKRSEAF